MKKQDFEKWLRYKLYDLPQSELEHILQYYNDAIADRMEDGMTEEEAVEAMGTPEEILAACEGGLPMQTTAKPSRKKPWLLLVAAGALLSFCLLALPKLFSTPVQSPPETDANHQNSWGGLHVQSGDDRVNIGWDGIHVQSGDDRVSIDWDGILAQSGEDRVDISWDGIRIQADEQSATDTEADVKPMTLNFATDCLRALSIYEDLGNITVAPSPDDEIHICFPDITQYDRQTTYDGILKIVRQGRRSQTSDLMVQVPEGFELSLETDRGNVILSGIAPGALDVKCDVGSVTGMLAGDQTDYNILSSVDVGSSNLPAQQQADGIPLTVRVDVGSIDLTFEEGNLT